MSIGKALAEGKPVVFSGRPGRPPQVVVAPGSELAALELLRDMGIIELLVPEQCTMGRRQQK